MSRILVEHKINAFSTVVRAGITKFRSQRVNWNSCSLTRQEHISLPSTSKDWVKPFVGRMRLNRSIGVME